MSCPRLPFLFKWYFRAELPGWGKLFRAFGMGGIDNQNPKWKDAPVLATRGKHHGYVMDLDLSNDLDRMTYFLGRYYDLPIQLLLDALLDPGTVFLDGGANVGKMTLHAAHCVGTAGRVISVEPIPENCDRIRKLAEQNDLSQISVVQSALGAEAGTMTLNILGGDTIMSTLRSRPDADETLSAKIETDVICGDTLFDHDLKEKLVIKLDLEGWEYFALQGLQNTIETHRPPVIIEIEPKYLREAGIDDDKLHEFFTSRGYSPYVLGQSRRRFGPSQLRLAEYETAQDLRDLNAARPDKAWMRQWLGEEGQYIDVVWLHNNHEFTGLKSFLKGNTAP